MSPPSRKPPGETPHEELRERLEIAEASLRALREGQIDRVVGSDENLVVRLARAERREAHLKRVLVAIWRVNQLIAGDTSRTELIARACERLTTNGGYEGAWIALMDESVRVTDTASSGFGEVFGPMHERLMAGDYPDCLHRILERDVLDVVTDPATQCPGCPLAEVLPAYGWFSRRLTFENRIYGALCVCVPLIYAQDAEEQHLFNTLAGDLGYALKRIEDAEALQEAVLRQQEAVRAANVGLWDWDLATNRVRFSREWKRQIGYEEHEISDSHEEWQSRVHPEDLPAALKRVERCLATQPGEPGEEYDNEFRFRHKNGSYRWILAQAAVQRDEEGRPIHLRGSHVDITQMKRTEQALRESEHQKELILNTTTEMVAYYDTDLRVIWANKAAADSVGLSIKDLTGRHCYEIWQQSDRPCEPCPVLQALEKKETCQGEQQTADGRWWSVRGYPVLDETGEAVALVELTMNITEQRSAASERERVEQQLQQSQRLESIGRLAGGVAHDLNNLLSPILGYGELLLEDAAGMDPRRESLQEIVRAGKRARDLVRQLLAFSRKQALESRPIDFDDLLRNFEKLLRRTIREDVAIHFELDGTLPPIRGDVGQLEQVVMNLAVNAQDAMPRGGELTIETSVAELDEIYALQHDGVTPGRYVRFAMRDTGCGMDAETRRQIFEPFFTTKGKEKGTGLGLATVYGIVKQHGGNVWVYSEPGLGTTFHIYLPASEEEILARQAPRGAGENLEGSETILLVEDDEQVRALTEAVLRRYGYRVLAAEDGPAALALLQKQDGPIDLLLTDVIMPGMNGRDLHLRVCERYPDLRVIFMSGYTDNVVVHHGVLEEGLDFVQKPFSNQTLAAKVRETLTRR